MSVAFTPSNVLAFVQQHMDSYGDMMKDKMDEADQSAQMMEDLAEVEKKLASWRQNDSNTVLSQSGDSVQKEAIDAMNALVEKYPELKEKLSDFIAYAENYQSMDNPGQCNGQIDSTIKMLDGLKDAYGKHDQLTMLEINDLNAKYNRVAELGNQFLASSQRTLDSIVKNIGG